MEEIKKEVVEETPTEEIVTPKTDPIIEHVHRFRDEYQKNRNQQNLDLVVNFPELVGILQGVYGIDGHSFDSVKASNSGLSFKLIKAY